MEILENNFFFFFKAAVNTRLVGLEIAYLLRILIEQHGLHAKDVHLIGTNIMIFIVLVLVLVYCDFF